MEQARKYRRWILAAVVTGMLHAQSTGDQDVYSIGDDVKPPSLIQKIEPKYTHEARASGIQGAVLLELVVDELGLPTDLTVLSPLGFGLDEAAQEAVTRWRFRPGTKEGKPVKVLATVETTFRLIGQPYDQKHERQRTEFNAALATLHDASKAERYAKARATMQRLSKEKYPSAMYLYGKMLATGDGFPADPEQGQRLIEASADAHYGLAIFEVGLMYLDGKGKPKDIEKGRTLIRNAAILGSIRAQYFLGASYESGTVLEKNEDSARQFYRLCAAQGEARCQFRLGVLLLHRDHLRERDQIQALAWLELAGEKGEEGARKIAATEREKLTPSQVAAVAGLKPKLVHP